MWCRTKYARLAANGDAAAVAMTSVTRDGQALGKSIRATFANVTASCSAICDPTQHNIFPQILLPVYDVQSVS